MYVPTAMQKKSFLRSGSVLTKKFPVRVSSTHMEFDLPFLYTVGFLSLRHWEASSLDYFMRKNLNLVSAST